MLLDIIYYYSVVVTFFFNVLFLFLAQHVCANPITRTLSRLAILYDPLEGMCAKLGQQVYIDTYALITCVHLEEHPYLIDIAKCCVKFLVN